MKPHPPIPSSKCIETHKALEPLLPILDAFNHRHKNQHRASHWWAEFQILRRSLRALASSALQCKGQKVRSRAQWMKKCIVSRSYLAFTQLAADNQHAPLGLVLLAALARINTVLLDLLPGIPQTSRSDLEEAQHEPTLDGYAGQDKGTVVSRQDLLALRRDTVRAATPMDNPGPVAKAASPIPSTEKKKKKKNTKKKGESKGDEWSSLFGNLN